MLPNSVVELEQFRLLQVLVSFKGIISLVETHDVPLFSASANFSLRTMKWFFFHFSFIKWTTIFSSNEWNTLSFLLCRRHTWQSKKSTIPTHQLHSRLKTKQSNILFIFYYQIFTRELTSHIAVEGFCNFNDPRSCALLPIAFGLRYQVPATKIMH